MRVSERATERVRERERERRNENISITERHIQCDRDNIIQF